MFNMVRVGSKISELRKAHNMTQMELADKVGISFQAVSNWERGVSMPDIAKLPELAELFEVTIDELLGQKSELLESVVQERSAEYLQSNTITAQDFTEIAPLLKPEQANEIFSKVKSSFELSEIVEILPFVSSEVAHQLARELAESGDYDRLGAVAPFVEQGLLDRMAEEMFSEGEVVERILPFLSSETLAQLAMSCYQEQGFPALTGMAPFLSQDILVQIAEWEYAKHGLKHFAAMAPFLNRKFLNELARQAIQTDGVQAISPIVPFLDQSVLSDLIMDKFLLF